MFHAPNLKSYENFYKHTIIRHTDSAYLFIVLYTMWSSKIYVLILSYEIKALSYYYGTFVCHLQLDRLLYKFNQYMHCDYT